MSDLVPDWIYNFNVEDKTACNWLMSYFNERRTSFLPRTDLSKYQSLKDHIVMLYEKDDDADFKFLTNMKAAYRQFEKRRKPKDIVTRTYEISIDADKELGQISHETKVSKNTIIDTLIREAANVKALFSDKKKTTKQLTVHDLINPYARNHDVGHFVFGSKTFPDEKALGKKINTIIQRLNKQANARSGTVDPLIWKDVLNLFIREGVVHNVHKSIAQSSLPGNFGRALTPEETERSIDDLRIDDVFNLDDPLRSRLTAYRDTYMRSPLFTKEMVPYQEELLVKKLLDEATENKALKQKVVDLQREKNSLQGSLREKTEALKTNLKELRFDDPKVQNMKESVEALGNALVKLVYERNAAIDREYSLRLKERDGADRRGVSNFEIEAINQSIKNFKEALLLVPLGVTKPEEIEEIKFPTPLFPDYSNDTFL